MFRYHRIIVLCHLFEQRDQRRIAGVSDCDRNVSTEAGILCPLDRRAAKHGTKVLACHLRHLAQFRIHQLGSRLELEKGSDWRLAVPWTHILTDVAAKDMAADPFTQLRRNRPPFFDSQVSDAARRVHLVWPNESLCRTRIQTSCASTAAICRRKRGR